MNRDSEETVDLIELGTASGDTQGNEIHTYEIGGFMPKFGISND